MENTSYYALCAGPYLTQVHLQLDSGGSSVFASADGSKCNLLLKDAIPWLPPFRIAAAVAAFILLLISTVETIRKYRSIILKATQKSRMAVVVKNNGFMLYVRMLGAVFFFFLMAIDPNNAFGFYPTLLYNLWSFGFFSIVLSQKFSIANHWQAMYLVLQGASPDVISKIQWSIQVFSFVSSVFIAFPTGDLRVFQFQKIVLGIVCTFSAFLNFVFGTWVVIESYKTQLHKTSTWKVVKSLLFYSVMTLTLSTIVSVCSIVTVTDFGTGYFDDAPVVSKSDVQTQFILFPLVLCIAFGCYTMIFLSTWKVSASSEATHASARTKPVGSPQASTVSP